MADTKLSALTELAATPANDDEVYIRDVSEAAADESKRITVTNLMAAADGTTIVTGNYTGNNTNGRQITLGFVPTLVIVMKNTSIFSRAIMIPGKTIGDHISGDNLDWTAFNYIHATDGFVVENTNSDLNTNAVTYYYWAIGA